MSNFQLIKSENFNGIKCNFYKNENEEILLTREQIGRALQYAYPRESIQKIHERNKDRLDKFSAEVSLTSPQGTKQKTTLYSYKGLYEICRYSKKPLADAFMDFTWDIIEEIRKTGSYTSPKFQLPQTYPDALRELANKYEENQKLIKTNNCLTIANAKKDDEIKILKPQANLAKAFFNYDNTTYSIGTAAKKLGVKPNKLFEYLRVHKVFMSSRENWNIPYQAYIDRGYFIVKESEKNGHFYSTPYVQPKGLTWLKIALQKNPIQ